MELSPFIKELSKPTAYSYPVARVEIRHTHISLVFLAGPFAFKIKKPVDLGFLDFSTLEKRRHFCEEEVRLNRRLAPTVYLGVVPIAHTARGIQMEAPGEIADWAVKMERLPESATLESCLRQGEILPAQMTTLARHLAGFHTGAETNDHISSFGRPEIVAQNSHENFDQAEPLVGC